MDNIYVKIVINDKETIEMEPGKKSIGRRDSEYLPDIDLTDFDKEKYISRKHGVFYFDGCDLVYTDNSKNGTLLNGEKINFVDRLLKDMDELLLGHVRIIVMLSENNES